MNFKEMIIAPSMIQRLEDDEWFTWGASVIAGDDGRYHMFVSRWKKVYTFFGWLTKSEIVRAVADHKEGPFTVVATMDQLMDQSWSSKMVHNPTIKKYGNHYYLYYIGTTYEDNVPYVPEDFGHPYDVINHPARYNQKIGVAIADSLEGPFIPSASNPVLDRRDGEWDCTFVCNPSIFIEDSGEVKMIYKAKLEKEEVLILGAAVASHPEGPFVRKGPSPLFNHDIEDPFMWQEHGTYYMLAKDMRGDVVDKYDGILFESDNGYDFRLSSNKLAWNHRIDYCDDRSERPLFVERPQLLIENGRPTCLYTAISNNRSHSYNLARLLK